MAISSFSSLQACRSSVIIITHKYILLMLEILCSMCVNSYNDSFNPLLSEIVCCGMGKNS